MDRNFGPEGQQTYDYYHILVLHASGAHAHCFSYYPRSGFDLALRLSLVLTPSPVCSKIKGRTVEPAAEPVLIHIHIRHGGMPTLREKGFKRTKVKRFYQGVGSVCFISIHQYLSFFKYFFKLPFFKVCVVCSNFVFTKRCCSFCSRVVKRLTGGKDYKNHQSHKKVRFMRKVSLGVKMRLRTKVRFGEVIFLVKVRFVVEVKLKNSSLSRSIMVFVEG